MKKLVIAEKPSFARNIMAALTTEGECFVSAGEYFESKQYIVTSAYGHIFELYSFEDYETGKDMWKIENLPFFPEEYRFRLTADPKTKAPDSGAQSRFNAIRKLLKRTDVDEVIHCGDADREGQLIIDLILEQARNTKPVTRPLIKDMTEETIVAAFKNRDNNENYQNVHDEGLVRTLVDYDYGINLSRYANVKTGARPALNIGRVIGAMVTAIYERDMAIKSFIPVPYYKARAVIEAEGAELELLLKDSFTKDEKDEAEKLAKRLSNATAKVIKAQNKEKIVRPPKLFSQSGLQNRMSKLYKFTPKQTLAAAQSLYEKGYTTYPRTNTEYLTENEREEINRIIQAHNVSGTLKYREDKKIFDSSKVDGHTAIVPTKKIPDLKALTEDEQKTYKAIQNRFYAVFWAEECIDSETKLLIQIEDYSFSITGTTQLSAGWRTIEHTERKDKLLPPLKEGDTFQAEFKVIEKETQPPKHYTVETFNNFLKNPFRTEKTTEDEAYQAMLSGIEIGTEATRAGMLAKAEEKNYISLKKGTYYIEERGIYLAEVMKTLGINMTKERTTEMAKLTASVASGNRSIKEVLNQVHEEITEIIRADAPIERQESGKEIIGKCPKCGADVVDINHAKLKAYKCAGECDFILWKTVFGGTLSQKNARTLLEGKKTGPVMLKSKAGKPYLGRFKLNPSNFKLDMEFVNSPKNRR